jgi:glutathione peroxidase
MTTLSDFSVRTLDGRELNLADYKDRVVLLVNVASRCGYTPQYKGLEALYKECSAQGLTVLGVPSNDFGAQEPGTEAEIKTFCETRYNVTFPMLAKMTVKGAEKHKLYEWLTSAPHPVGEVAWNFEKFLIDRGGNVVGRFKSNVAPESQELRAAIAQHLG